MSHQWLHNQCSSGYSARRLILCSQLKEWLTQCGEWSSNIICIFYLSVAACTTVNADLSLTYILHVLGTSGSQEILTSWTTNMLICPECHIRYYMMHTVGSHAPSSLSLSLGTVYWLSCLANYPLDHQLQYPLPHKLLLFFSSASCFCASSSSPPPPSAAFSSSSSTSPSSLSSSTSNASFSSLVSTNAGGYCNIDEYLRMWPSPWPSRTCSC